MRHESVIDRGFHSREIRPPTAAALRYSAQFRDFQDLRRSRDGASHGFWGFVFVTASATVTFRAKWLGVKYMILVGKINEFSKI
jgi:hypothetical protein